MATFITSWIGQSLEEGRFLVGEKLGEGGMAIVFRAIDQTNHADVVIKVPKQNALEDKTFLKRFAAENRALINLRHPHVVSILHVGEFESWPFAVLQHLTGGDLDVCREAFGGKLSLLNVSKWLPPIADALDFIHGQGYIHRDVKPANVLFDGQGQAFLSDFGVAKVVSDQASKMTNLTGTGMVLGTPDYMAPELIMGRPIDGRVDQYALAMTIYECLAGRLPFRAPTPAAILVMQTTQKVPPLEKLNPAIPLAVSQTIMQALAKKPAERFATCNAFAHQLLEAIEQSGLSAAPPTEHLPTAKLIEIVDAKSGSHQTVSQRTQTTARDPSQPRPAPRTKTPNRAATARRRSQQQESIWQNKQFLIAGGVAAAIVALLIIMVIIRSLRSPETPPLAQSPSSPPQDVPIPFAGTKAGQEWKANGLGMAFCWCPPGTFIMGSPPSEKSRVGDENQVPVSLTRGFWIGKREVTQNQWQRVMGTTPWQWKKYVKEGPDYAASYISWDDAIAFCQKLTDQERQAGRLPEGWDYALPTEAQWEYACRAGTTTAYSFGEDESQLGEYAWWGSWHSGNAKDESYAHAVGRKKANPWGLYDVHGNMWEWCADWYGLKSPGGRDPEVTRGGSNRVNRGGSWGDIAGVCRSAFRGRTVPGYRINTLGFRVACVPSRPLAQTSASSSPQDIPIIGTKAGQERQDNGLGMAFCWCPAGTFTMGGRGAGNQVPVTLTQGFWLGTREVTQGEWQQIMGTTPWQGQEYVKAGPEYAATFISWNEATAFCQKLTTQERQAGRLPEGWEFTLPTEAQWEYACRAGTTTAYSFGEDESQLSDYAWWGGLNGNGNAKTEQHAHKVGQKKPNPWGLCDVHGNLWEWCRDWHSSELPGGRDPEVTVEGSLPYRVDRGGSWDNAAWFCRPDIRGRGGMVAGYHYIGFRVACVSSGK